MEEFVQGLDPDLFDRDVRFSVTVADGTPQKVLGSVNLPVSFDRRIEHVRFAIIPAISHPLILGSDFCRLFRLKVDFAEQSCDLASIHRVESINRIKDFSSLTEKEMRELDSIIDGYKELSSKAPGRTTMIEHFIDTGDARPTKQRQYPISPALQKFLYEEIDEMLRNGVIERSSSPWSSPILMVRKQDGSYRMCFDGRKLNQVTVKDSYPLPLIDSILSKLGEATYISSLDITKAFWNVPLEESSKVKTAFQVHGKGLFQFKMMPFGLCNSAQTMQRLMDMVLGPELDPYVFCYLDDIIVVSKDLQEHFEILREVCRRLRNSGLSINLEKCQFCRQSLSFLGFVIDQNGLRTDPNKVESILQTPVPTNTTEVRSLIGILTWYRRFIPDFSTISTPITNLIKGGKKGIPIKWTEEAQKAFETLKERLVSAPVLASPKWDEKFYIQTDASDVGLGAVLFQEIAGEEHPICYASRKLSKAEKKYSVTERECLAVLFGVEKFRPYVEATNFTIITDHASLLWLYKLKDPIGRLARWTVRLSQFNMNIVHRKGAQNVVADFLSRHIANLDVEDLCPDEWYLQMIQKVTKDPCKYPDFLVEGNLLFKHLASKHGMVSNISNWKLVVPTANRKDILQECHDGPLAAHLGIYKTLARVTERYYWPGLNKDVRYYVKTCKTCGAYKAPNETKPGLMGHSKKVEFPFQNISLDLMGPFPRSKKGNTQLLVVTDWFTKFILVQPIPKATSKNVIRFLENQVFLLFGVPQTIMCDNGVQFTSGEFKDFLRKYNVQNTWYNARYHPQVNPTERVNKVLGTAIASYVKNDHKEWDIEVFKIAQAIRTARHEVTGYPPAFLNFGRIVPVDGKFYGPAPDHYKDLDFEDKQRRLSDLQKLPKLFSEVQERLNKAYETSAHKYNLRRRPAKFEVGDKVWKTNFTLSDASKNFSKKLAPKYVPCIVRKVKGSGLVYELTDLDGKYVGDFHIQDLKPYHEREELSIIDNTDHITEVRRDLFSMPEDYCLAHCVAADLRMSSGIATEFKERFGRVDDLRQQQVQPGGVAFIRDGDRYIFYLVTKWFSNGKPTYCSLFRSLSALKDKLSDLGIKKLAIPRIGSGLDHLEWARVRNLLEICFHDSGIDITVCSLTGDAF